MELSDRFQLGIRINMRFVLVIFLMTLAPGTPAAYAQSPDDPFFIGAYDRARAEAMSQRPMPKLVVLLVFDQMRAELLGRLLPVVEKDGFGRLTREGATFTDCTIPYAATYTGPGHATISTGATPRIHGIVGNSWFDFAEGERVNCVRDSTVWATGVPSGAACSPRRLLALTVGDMLRSDTRGVARVVSVGGKDRSAVLLAGHHPNAVFWQDRASALMQSSSYYGEGFPHWARTVNQLANVDSAYREAWEPTLHPIAYLTTVPTEGVSQFPHTVNADQIGGDDNPLREMPFSLRLLFDFAEQAVVEEELGADGVCDLLTIAISVTDLVGHRYGPDSAEYLDIYAQADREIAGFLDHLDRVVGRGEYVVAVSSDHGVAPSPVYAEYFEASVGDSIGGVHWRSVMNWGNRVMENRYGAALDSLEDDESREWIRAVAGALVTLNLELLEEAEIDLSLAASTLVDSAGASPWYLGGYSAFDPRPSVLPHAVVEAVKKSYYPGRSGHVFLVTAPNVFFGRPGHGQATSHGSPYRYDTHVPLLLWGWGVAAGIYRQPVSLVDVAPTLADLMGVRHPPRAEGRSLIEALDIPAASWEPGGH